MVTRLKLKRTAFNTHCYLSILSFGKQTQDRAVAMPYAPIKAYCKSLSEFTVTQAKYSATYGLQQVLETTFFYCSGGFSLCATLIACLQVSASLRCIDFRRISVCRQWRNSTRAGDCHLKLAGRLKWTLMAYRFLNLSKVFGNQSLVPDSYFARQRIEDWINCEKSICHQNPPQ